MSAYVYTIEDILLGTYYHSRRGSGRIITAEKRDDVWYDGADAYTVCVRPDEKMLSDFYATVAVAN